MGNWFQARMSPGLTFVLQVLMVGVIVLDIVLGIVGIVIFAVQSKKLSKKLRLRPGGSRPKEGEAEEVALVGPEEEEDPVFGFVGMPRNQPRKGKDCPKFVIIPPAVPRKIKKRTQIMREQGAAAT
ncbi:unnamed protein product [Cylicocyclus nassatus]|uniref:Uncharacterized protein n=1 Tax=Cylicocyclus nassatus TaxID=53992 RepID=A0AA36H4Q4_CYLNA|nr:unnamed protein product [Cylicocyclus nassatus]